MTTKRKTSIIAYILVVCMLAGLLPTTAFAEEEQTFLCGKEFHSHNESCYDEFEALICEKEEHTHTEKCLAEDVNNKDVQTEENTEKQADDEQNKTNDEKSTDDEQNKTNDENSTDDEQNKTNDENSTDDEQNKSDDENSTDDEQNKSDDEKTTDDEQNKTNDEKQGENEQTTIKKARAATRETGETHDHTIPTGSTWTELTNDNLTINQDGYYYLSENFTDSLNITGGEVTLCLNGHTLTGNSDHAVITVSGSSTKLTLCNCNGTGTITGSKMHGVSVSDKSTFIMESGTISGNEVPVNASDNGAGVYVNNSTFKMTGGTIENNTAGYYGGGVFVNNGGTFEMVGGTITGNKVRYGNGGGVSIDDGSTFNVSGSATITNNTLNNSNSTTANNVHLPDNQTITVTGNLSGEIGVTVATSPTDDVPITVAKSDNDTSAYFTSDDENYMTAFDETNNTVILGVKRVKRTVTFNTDGGSIIASQEVMHGKTATKPTDPAKSGYTFLGWFVGDTEFDFSTTITSDITLTAKWKEITNYTVTFNTDGGSTVDSQSIAEGTTVSKPTDPAKQYYTFLGWFVGDTEFDFNTPITSNITLTAKWEKATFTVTFDSNGGSAVTPSQVNKGGTATKPTDPAKSGYTFLGWFAEGATEAFDFSTTITSDITLTAKWKEITNYTVTFNTDGGSTVDSQSIAEGTTVAKPTDPTKQYYTFLGWFAGDTEFDFNTPITSNITLTAKWERKTFTVTFDSNGGSAVTPKTVTVKAGEKVAKPADPTRKGWYFASWNIEGNSYNFDTPVTENITLHAVWAIFQPSSIGNIIKKYSISGTVKYSDGTPIPNAVVKLGVTVRSDEQVVYNKTVTADSEGNYAFSDLNMGSYTIMAIITEDGEERSTRSIVGLAYNKDAHEDITFLLKKPILSDEDDNSEINDLMKEHITSLLGTTETIVNPNTSTLGDSSGIISVSGLDEVSQEYSTPDAYTVIQMDVDVATTPNDVTNIDTSDDVKEQVVNSMGKHSVVLSTATNVTRIKMPKADDAMKIDNESIRSTKSTVIIKTDVPKIEKSNMPNKIINEIINKAVKAKKITVTTPNQTRSADTSITKSYDDEKVKVAGRYTSLHDDDEVKVTELTMLTSEPTTPQPDTFWFDGENLHLYINEMAIYVINYDVEYETIEETKPSKSSKSGRTGTWVKEEKIAEVQKPEETSQTIENNQPDNTDVPVDTTYNHCSKDSRCTLTKFADMNVNEWYHDGAHYCVENGLISGVSSTLFSPNENATRAMIVAMLWRMENQPVVDYDMSFADVADTAYYRNAVRWAVSAGIVSGYNEKTFAPDDAVTREQIASILYRYTQYKGKEEKVQNVASNFEDVNDISSYAVNAMNWACGIGMINGTSSTMLSPKSNATRAQIAQMLKVYLNQ